MDEQTCLFGSNFLEKLVGKNILHNPLVAIVEFVVAIKDPIIIVNK